MAKGNIPFSLPGFHLTEVKKQDERMVIKAISVQTGAQCPNCRTHSTRVHSYYSRAPADLPISESRVQLQLTVRRFRCQAKVCTKATFAESFPDFMARYARRTSRLGRVLKTIAFALGGRPGSRLAEKLEMPVSGDTLLRIIRDTPEETQATPEVIGVDDWAKRRGHVYGTIVVDLERRQVIDLLEDRTAETLEKWLRSNKSVKIVARDRSTEYARGIAKGAPQAGQVADRWHLLVNLREALERIIDRLRPELNTLATTLVSSEPEEIPLFRKRKRSGTNELAKKERMKRNQDLHTEIHRLYKAGISKCAIARQLGKHRATINKHLEMRQHPPVFTRKRVASILDPYEDNLRRSWKKGCRNASELWREIQETGFSGTRKQVAQWVYERREQLDASTPYKYREAFAKEKNNSDSTKTRSGNSGLPVARRLVWVFLKPRDKLTPDESKLRTCLLDHKILAQAVELAEEFQRMIRARELQGFADWLEECESSKIPELRNLALGMRKDISAIRNALQLSWSNGQTEGQINRLKLLKRQMYGRAKFDLLRLRCLHPP